MIRRLILNGLLALLVAPSSVSAMEFASLRSQISARGITTVEGLVESLPEPLRAHYALVFRSRSLQGASYANPRAILFGDDASLVITFNGDPSHRGYDAVETMEFNASSNSFLFREIRFADPDAPPTVSESNPPRCTACHGTPARPIWDTTSGWPGVYGERYHSGLSPQEAKGIREYLARQPAHPRYRALLGSRRFAERDTYVANSTTTYNGLTTEPPNAQFSALLTRLNTRAIVATLKSQPGYEAHRYALLAAAKPDCGPLADFYPPMFRASLNVQLREFLASLERIDRQQEAAKAARLADGRTGWSRAGRPLDMGQLRFVAERGLGVSTAFWTMALEHNTYDLAAPPDTWSLGEALFEAVTITDGTLAELHAYHSFDSGDAYCKRLAERSRQALERWYAVAAADLPSSRRSGSASRTPVSEETQGGSPPALALCIACHSGEVARQIPFNDPQALAPRLLEGDYPRGRLLDEICYRLSDAAGGERMPRGTLISSDQIRALQGYFVEIANGLGETAR